MLLLSTFDVEPMVTLWLTLSLLSLPIGLLDMAALLERC